MSTPVPDFTEPILAARSWSIVGRRLLPAVLFLGGEWKPEENVAQCGLRTCEGMHADDLADDLAPPTMDDDWLLAYKAYWRGLTNFRRCSCGFYAVKRPSQVTRQLNRAAGVVALYGRVVEHRRGWRASRARIVALVAKMPWKRWQLRKIAREYGVPLKFFWPQLTETVDE